MGLPNRGGALASRAAKSAVRLAARAAVTAIRLLLRTILAMVGPVVIAVLIAALALLLVVGAILSDLYGGARRGDLSGTGNAALNARLLATYKAAAAATAPANAPADYRDRWAVPWELLAAIDRVGFRPASAMPGDARRLAAMLRSHLTFEKFAPVETVTTTVDGKATTRAIALPPVAEVVSADTWDGTYRLSYSPTWTLRVRTVKLPDGRTETVTTRVESFVRASESYTEDFSRLIAAMRTVHVSPQDISIVLSVTASFDGAVIDWATTTPAYYAGLVPVPAPSGDTVERVLHWKAIIAEVAAADQLDPALVAGVITVESGGDPNAVSPAGALGLMQALPGKFTPGENPFDPLTNIEVGAAYLKAMLGLFRGNVELALAAYNAGPGAVLAYGGIPPYPETLNYVPAVLSAERLYTGDFQGGP